MRASKQDSFCAFFRAIDTKRDLFDAALEKREYYVYVNILLYLYERTMLN